VNSRYQSAFRRLWGTRRQVRPRYAALVSELRLASSPQSLRRVGFQCLTSFFSTFRSPDPRAHSLFWPISFPLIFLRTLLQTPNIQLFCFHAIPNSFAKTPGGGCPPARLLVPIAEFDPSRSRPQGGGTTGSAAAKNRLEGHRREPREP
jgi:hypothetical protein